MKKSFLIYIDSLDVLEELSDEEAGQLFKAVRAFHQNKVVELSPMVRVAFSIFKTQFKRDDIKAQRGEHHWNWKGGVTEENHALRNSAEYKNWRKLIFIRDNYTCQECEILGGKLNAHHIKTWAEFPELRFEVGNGVTLCEDCHKEVHRNG